MRAASGSGIRRVVRALFVAAMLVAATACATHQQVTFAPSIATMADDGKGMMSIQGRISEAPDSLKRRWIIDSFPLNIEPGPDRRAPLFRDRAGRFWSDSDMIEPVSAKIGSRVLVFPATDSGGYFTMQVALTNDEVAQLKREGAISFQSLTTNKTPISSSGTALLVPEVGMTVITDVDDTIKVTEVTKKPERDANTFVRPFKPVQFMPELYTGWQQAYGPGIHFHVVSAGPWQLHEPIRKFTESAGFPPFTWHMRSMKITDFDSLKEALDPDVGASRREEFKVKAIREFMYRFKQRHVVLVGDSGEQDPEAYARILSEFGDRVNWVLIRDVSNDPQLAQNNRSALFARPEHASKLRVFSDPRELFSLPLTPARRVPQ
jgi:phosphatidate phosphatase APP1